MRAIKPYGHKIYFKLKVYESGYKRRAKISTEKLFQASIVKFSLISFHLMLIKILEKYL